MKEYRAALSTTLPTAIAATVLGLFCSNLTPAQDAPATVEGTVTDE
ncbi:MAG: hypothetical protein GY783_07380 [Gammaproteobacteria bacterium]|nr:hypothetical protein [Gammaproteobacteria bacterium]